MRRWLLVLAVVVTWLALVPVRDLAHAAPLDDEPTFSAPTVQLSRYSMRPGESIGVQMGGFSSVSVTVTVCGNQGLRGTSDCFVEGGEAVETRKNGGTADISFIVNAPPVPCPCIIRVASPTSDEVAIADITLIGHPVAELVGGSIERQPLAARIVAEPTPVGAWGWAKSSLGGATTYDVTLTLQNRSNLAVTSLVIDGSVGRGGDDVGAILEFPQPGVIGPNDTWEETIQVELPAPVYGNAAWRVTIASDGPSVTTRDTTSHLPGLLLFFIVFLLADLLFLLYRLIKRRQDRKLAERAHAFGLDPDGAIDPDGPDSVRPVGGFGDLGFDEPVPELVRP